MKFYFGRYTGLLQFTFGDKTPQEKEEREKRDRRKRNGYDE
jgi:hypothetical protein